MPEQRAWRAYLSGSAWLQGALNRDLEQQAGMSLNEYEILVRLSEAPDQCVRMSTLAEHLVHSRSRLTHTIARMEKRGWVDRRACTEDGRGVEAVLTTEGYAVLEQTAPGHVESVRRHLIDILTPEQVEMLGEIFTEIALRLDPEAEHVLAIGEAG